MKLLFIILITLFTTTCFAQDILDVDKHLNCELFIEKGDFNKEERLKQINALEGKLVTVYRIKANNKKIKQMYSGEMYNSWKNKHDFSLDHKTSVITIRTKDSSGNGAAYFPHTNKKDYRIYLTECLENK